MKMNKNQSGRSMVEMLGVLAIIGVLSVGGITGYKMAMDRHRANEILNAWSLLKIEWMRYPKDEDSSVDFDFGEFQGHGSVGSVGFTAALTVDHISTGTCDILKDSMTGIEGWEDGAAFYFLTDGGDIIRSWDEFCSEERSDWDILWSNVSW